MTALFLDAVGAITPVGLSAAHSCAAIRARVSRIADVIGQAPPDESLKGARIKAGRGLQRTPRDWLLNMAARALGECLDGLEGGGGADAGGSHEPIAVFVCCPEPERAHPGMDGVAATDILRGLEAKIGRTFLPASRVFQTGAAGLLEGMRAGRELLRSRAVDRFFVGGVDSLLNAADVERLMEANRIHRPENPQGVIPGEGAVFLSFSATGRSTPFMPLAVVHGFALDREKDVVNGPKYSLGRALTSATVAALSDANVHEKEVEFVVSNHTGERYAAWETTMAHARSYRTRREGIPVTYPAGEVGHLGAASGALALLVSGMAVARGHAPGPTGVCEIASEGELRGACVVGGVGGTPAFSVPAQRRERASQGNPRTQPAARAGDKPPGDKAVSRGAPALWDVMEEHLDEGGFLLAQWLNAARSARFTLGELRQTIEYRLLAHVEALAIGGRAVADKLLWPCLADKKEENAEGGDDGKDGNNGKDDDDGDEDERSVEDRAAAALALIVGMDPTAAQRLMDRLLLTTNPLIRKGIVLALQLNPTDHLDEAVRHALYATDVPAVHVALLDVLARRRIDPGPILGPLLASKDPAVFAAALRVASAGDRAHQHFVEDGLSHGEASARTAAVRVGLVWNLESARRAAWAAARGGDAEAMVLLASCGGPDDVRMLLELLGNPKHAAGALWALGFSGRPMVVDACLPLLGAPEAPLAKLAAEAIRAISGAPAQDTALAAPAGEEPEDEDLPPLEEDLARDLRPQPTDELPVADAAKMAAWWSERRSQLSPEHRYLNGVPLSASTVEQALRSGPLRRTGPLALELAIRSAGRVQLPALRLGQPAPQVPTDLQFQKPPRWS